MGHGRQWHGAVETLACQSAAGIALPVGDCGCVPAGGAEGGERIGRRRAAPGGAAA